MDWDLGFDMFRGLCRYLGGRRWHWLRISEEATLSPGFPPERVDGILGHFGSLEAVEACCRLGVPVVNTSAALAQPGAPTVSADNRAVGAVAADHLRDAGFEHFAFLGVKEHAYSDQRWEGFRARLGELGAKSLVPVIYSSQDWSGSRARWQQVLADSPKPLGVFACQDQMALEGMRICLLAGLAVPETVSVLGADNLERKCEFHTPSLSSVSISWERIGYEAARVLDNLMSGQPAPDGPVLVPPGEVVQRASTDVLAVEDKDLRMAMQIINRHAGAGMDVRDILANVPVTRRALEKKFRRHLGRTPAAHIRHVRVNRARRLLLQTSRELSDIAVDCGFCSQSHFTRVFREHTGLTPAAYRKSHQ